MPLIAAFGVAAAHDAIGSGALRPFVRDGALAGAWTTWGVVRAEGEGWQRVCEEANPGLRDAWLRADGSVVLARADGLASSDDGGCTSAPLGPSEPVALFAHVAGQWWVVVDRAGGDALLASDDELRTVLEVPVPAGLDLRSLAEDAAGGWWAAGTLSGAAVILGPAGVVEGPDPAAVAVVAHGPNPSGPGVVVSTVDPTGRAALWTGPPWARWVELPAPVTGFGCVGERCVVALDRTGLFAFDASAPALAQVDGPAACLVADGGALWACGAPGDPVQVARSVDGVTFTPALEIAAVTDATCGACPTFDTGAAPLQPPPPVELADRGCGGCRGGAALALGWVGSRRRRKPDLAPRRVAGTDVNAG